MHRRTLGCALLAGWTIALAALPSPACGAGVRAGKLRCEYLANPRGLGVVQPRLSWILEPTHVDARRQRQRAYQVVVSTDEAAAQAGRGDLWDSGKVESDQTFHVEYAGRPLTSGLRCWWSVRCWDGDDQPTEWSKPAAWTMGLLAPADWQAQWITAAEVAQQNARTNGGFLGGVTRVADEKRSITLDLGQAQTVDAVRLYPLHGNRHFPLRFNVELADEPTFAKPRLVVDRTGEDVVPPIANRLSYAFAPGPARYVRLTATKMGDNGDKKNPHYAVGLAEIEVLAAGRNVALGSAVTASHPMETPFLSAKHLVDGERVAIAPYGNKQGQPVPRLRKRFGIPGEIKRATVYVTARGVYELRLNGKRVGDEQLAPGWTEYNVRIPCQSFDVTPLLRAGDNAIAATVAPGWYAGPLGALAPRGRELYGPFPQLLARLDVETADGRVHTIATDESWRGTTGGPIRFSEIYDGEIYDARREQPGWDTAAFDDAGWTPVDARPLDEVKLAGERMEAIRITRTLEPVNVTEPRPGVYVFDMGQNMVGWCRLKVRASAASDDFITVRHAEHLEPDGSGVINTQNLFTARAADIYTTRPGGGEQVFEPHFTYHGFRYVQVEGLPAAPAPGDLVGCVVHSDAPVVSQFESSSETANALVHNIRWTQWGNMHSVPTDCPQRSERLGWMGDIQAFSQTSTYHMDMAAFLGKWMQDVRDAQFDNGAFTALTPHFHTGLKNRPIKVAPGGVYGVFAAAPAWSDAGTVIPWSLYVNYADRRLLAEHFDAARRWVDYMHRNNPDTLLFVDGRGEQYNDWLAGAGIPTDLFSTAFFAHSADLVSRMAAVLGRAEDAQRYRKLFHDVRAAFNKAFVKPDGTVGSGSQSCYVFALNFNLLDDALRPQAVEKLLAGIKASSGHVTTGIQASHRLILELSRAGHHAEACRLVNLRTKPSWGYMIEKKATTIWEHWDNHIWASGNHFAHASVGQWLWEHVAGIRPDEAKPGYQHILIEPKPGPGFTWARAHLDSIRGRIATDWTLQDGRFTLDVTIPPNTTATVSVPTSDPASVREGDGPASAAAGVSAVHQRAGVASFRVEPGRYRFTAQAAGQ